MEDRNLVNPVRNISSREGGRLPSRERNNFEQNARKTFTQMGSTQQNFLRSSTNFSESLSSSTEDLMLSSVNIAIDETGFIATIKTDILQIQEEINKLDIDGAIRGTNPSEILKKNHIYAMYKYLSKYSQMNLKKFMESKLSHANQCDLENLLKFMSVRNGSEGLRKLYKLMTVMDIMLMKLTEYQIVSFLKYDKIHEGIRQQLNLVSVNKNQSMDTGINISRFQVTQALIDRLFEVYEFAGKLQQQGDGKGSFITATNTNSNLKSLRTLEDLAKLLKSGEHLGLPGEIVISLLDLIRKDGTSVGKKDVSSKGFKETEQELAYQIDRTRTLEKELESLGEAYKDALQQLNSKSTEKSKETPSASNKEYERRIKYYGEQLEALTSDKQRLESSESKLKEENQRLLKADAKARAEIAELKSKIESLAGKIKEESPKDPNAKTFHPFDNENPEYFINLVKDIESNYSEKVNQLRSLSVKLEKENENLKSLNEVLKGESDENIAEITKLEARISKMQKTKEDTYENALREETEMMKKGFEMKVKKLQEEVLTVKKERNGELIELRSNLQREKDSRELLLRKLQIYTKT